MTEIEKRYAENGLKNYILRNTDDLKNVHGVDVVKIKGYKKLNVNEEFFKKMLVSFYNAQGLQVRSRIEPLAVRYVPSTKNTKSYLRFDVKIGDRNEWYHFNRNGEWY